MSVSEPTARAQPIRRLFAIEYDPRTGASTRFYDDGSEKSAPPVEADE
jgi:hypothetical protein